MTWQGTGGNFTITFSGFQQPQAPPACGKCGVAPAVKRDQIGRFWCDPCLVENNRLCAVASAQNWLEAAFMAVRADQRARLYKMLAAAFHPDTGGDPDLMIALNAVRERFP